MSCLMHTQNQQTIQKGVSLVIYSAILSNAQQSLLFKNLSIMIMIRYDRLRDFTSKLPLVNCNKRIIYISIAHFTQSKFGCLPSQNRIRLEFQKTVILKILFRKTALEKRRECISFLASKAACLFVCEKSKLLMDLSKSHPLLLSISVFQSSSSSFPIFFSLGKRRWKSCHYSQFVQIRGSQFQIGKTEFIENSLLDVWEK